MQQSALLHVCVSQRWIQFDDTLNVLQCTVDVALLAKATRKIEVKVVEILLDRQSEFENL